MHPRTYRRHKIKALEREHVRLNNTIQNSVCVFWIDNFNKYFRKSHLDGMHGPYQTVAWTAIALSKVPDLDPNSTLHLRDGHGSVIASYNPYPIDRRTIRAFRSQFNHTTHFVHCDRRYSQSVATLNSVFSTPLQIRPEGGQSQDDLIRGSDSGLRNFQSIDLHSANVSSALGLCDVLEDIRHKYWTPGRYFLLKVDINIYWRMAKVCRKLAKRNK